MATEKILQTRILMKVDTLENWEKSTLGLKKGELAFATVAATAGNGLTEPVVMVKIGEDGVKTFKDLSWNFYAKASDVIAAAKSEDTLRTFINGVITDAGVATDDALKTLAEQVTTNKNDIATLKGDANTTGSVAKAIADAIAALDLANTYDAKGAAAQALADAKAYVDGKDTAMDERVDVLEAAIAADGVVDTKIQNAINALDVTDTAVAGKYVSAVNEVDGKVVITRADLPDYTETYAAKVHGHEIADVNGLADAIADAKKAGTDANAALETYKGTNDAAVKKVADDLAAEVLVARAAEKANADAITAMKDHASVDSFADVMAEIAKKQDIIPTNTYDAYGAAAQALTDANAYTDGKDTAMDTRVKALEDKFGDGEGNVEAQIAAAVAAEAKLREDADADLQEAIDAINDAENGILAQAKAHADGKDEAIAAAQKAGDDAQDAVDALAAKVGEVPEDKTVVQMIADAQATATYDDTKVKEDIAANAENIAKNASAIELLTNGVSADEVDGVNDLIQYVKDHGTEVTGMKADIKANGEAITAEKTRAEGVEGGLDTRLKAIEAIDIADKAYADQAEADAKAHADGLNTAMNARVEALEAVDHEHANKALLDTYTQTEANLADAVAKKHDHANKAELDKFVDGDKAKLDSAVQTVTAAADSGLKATRTGNDIAIEIDDSIVFVFDCGDAGVTA